MCLKIESGDGIFLLLDPGSMTSGYLVLDITAPEEARVDIGFGEHLEDLRVRTSVGGRSFVVTSCAGPNWYRFIHYFRRLGCRYLQIFLHCREAVVYEAGILPVTYPVDESLSFVSSDSLHNRIYETAKRTVRQVPVRYPSQSTRHLVSGQKGRLWSACGICNLALMRCAVQKFAPFLR